MILEKYAGLVIGFGFSGKEVCSDAVDLAGLVLQDGERHYNRMALWCSRKVGEKHHWGEVLLRGLGFGEEWLSGGMGRKYLLVWGCRLLVGLYVLFHIQGLLGWGILSKFY